MTPPRLVIATLNRHKYHEITSILHGIPHELVPLWSLKMVSGPDESGATYRDNALIKASEASKIAGLPAIADDSGLEVDALGGRPGVHSKRMFGHDLSDREKYLELIRHLEGVKDADRTARFISVTVLTMGDELIYESRGEVEGRIIEGARGEAGFGYDPVFWIPAMACTMAELGSEAKNGISHRGLAMRGMKEFLLRNPCFLDKNARL